MSNTNPILELLNLYPSPDPADFETLISWILEHPDEVSAVLEHADSQYSEQDVFLTLGILRDGLITPFDSGLRHSFAGFFTRQGLTEKIRLLLGSPNITLRQSAVHTLGKIGDRGSLPLLHSLFDSALVRDPLLISSLLFEINWLSKQRDFLQLSHQILSQNSGVLNWALLDYLESSQFGTGTRLNRGKLALLKRLKKDPRFFVRNQAAYTRHRLVNKRAAKFKKNLALFLNGSFAYDLYRGPTFFQLAQEYTAVVKYDTGRSYSTSHFDAFVKDRLKKGASQ